jgi:hypothetical protein
MQGGKTSHEDGDQASSIKASHHTHKISSVVVYFMVETTMVQQQQQWKTTTTQPSWRHLGGIMCSRLHHSIITSQW